MALSLTTQRFKVGHVMFYYAHIVYRLQLILVESHPVTDDGDLQVIVTPHCERTGLGFTYVVGVVF